MATILLVDDDLMILKFCTKILTGTGGLHILQAANGIQAIEIATRRAGNIDMLVSDISMPGGINGIDLAEIVTRSYPSVKVLLMSGFSTEALSLHSSWQFLAKPFRGADLVSKIETALATCISSIVSH